MPKWKNSVGQLKHSVEEGITITAYSFKKQFIEPILAGTKPQTMRNERKRHARPAEEVQLYYGMRTKQCRLIGRAICTAVTPVRIDFQASVVKIAGRPRIHKAVDLVAFAIRDGFADWDHLCDFWDNEHAEVVYWEGVLIEWKDFKPGEQP